MAHTHSTTARAMAEAAAHPTGPHLVLVVLCIVLALARGVSLLGDANASTGTAAPLHTPEQVYQMALEARTERDYPAMLALLREAGNAGDLRAQELLASTLLAGPALHGGAVAGDACEAAMWARRAAEQGSAVARHQLMMLNGPHNAGLGCAPTH